MALMPAVLNLDWKHCERRGTVTVPTVLYSCLVFQDPRERTAGNCRSHENTQSHQQNLLRFQSEPSRTAPVPEPSQTPIPDLSLQANQQKILEALVRSITGTARPNQPHYPQLEPQDFPGLLPNPTHSETSDLTGLRWDLDESLQLDDDPWREAASRVAQASLDFLNGDLSDGEENERSDMSDEEQVSIRIGL
jgi:hypothetical protein